MIGSYFVAQEVRVKRPRRKAKGTPAAPPEPEDGEAVVVVDEESPVETPSR